MSVLLLPFQLSDFTEIHIVSCVMYYASGCILLVFFSINFSTISEKDGKAATGL